MNGGLTYSRFLSFSQTFGYDNANRLTWANDTGGWSRNFVYDPYGNRWVRGFTEMIPAGNTPQNQNQFTSNNRIIGNAYDAAGNRLIANGKMANYGAENRLVVQVTGAFAYTERPKAWRTQSRDCDYCRGEPDVADSASLPWTGLRPVGFA